MSRHLPRSKSVIIRQRNYKNIQLHSCLDQAYKYSSLVNNHIINTQHQNHALKTAEHPYQFTSVKFSSQKLRKSQIQLRKKQSNPEDSKPTFDGQQSPKKSNQENNFGTESKIFESQGMISSKIRIKSATKYPHSIPYQSFYPFLARTQKIADINQLLVQRQQQKKDLNKKIQMLKKAMAQQKKKIKKLNLASSKHMNGIEMTDADTRKKQQQSFHYNIQIGSLQQSCVQLVKQINHLNENIDETKATIAEETAIRDQTKKQVYDARIMLRRVKQDVAEAKHKISVAQKAMTNNYMVMNNHKDEKAKLFNYIQNDVKQHPICKPFCRVQDD